jgi:general secretion pathway protein A
MYLDFYHLKNAPFQMIADPAFLFLSASHKAALDTMAGGIATRRGLVTITGARGVGKTTLVHAYLARIAPPQLTTIVSWHAHLSFPEVLALIARRFAVPEAPHDATALLAHTQQLLRQACQQGRTVALIIDEAQHLPIETLEQLLLLANLTPSEEPLLQLVLVGQPELQQHLRRRPLRRVAQRTGIRATIMPLTKAESLAYIRQRVAKVALPGGPLFTPGALQAIVRHAQGMPHEVNLLCTNVLQAGFWAQQQPITADLVQQVIATSADSRPFPLGRLGLTAAAGLVLAVGLVWVAPFNSGPQATHSHPTARARSWMEERRPTSVPLFAPPHLPPPDSAPQVQPESTPDRPVGQDLGEGHDRLVPLEGLESRHLEPPPAPGAPDITPTPPAASAPPTPLSPRATPTPPVPPKSRAFKPCDELKAEIQAKLDAKGLTDSTLTIIAREDLQGHHVVGSCEGSTKKIVLNRSRNAP